MNVEDMIKESLGIESKEAKKLESNQDLILKELKELNKNLKISNKNSEKIDRIYEILSDNLGDDYDSNGFLVVTDEIDNLKTEIKSEIDKMSDRIKNQVDVNGKIIEDTINKKMR